MSIAKYRLFEGPGHAWLEVPVSEVTADMHITDYSWTVGDKYYLEEDVDMWRFLSAKYGKDFTGANLDRIATTVYRNAPGSCDCVVLPAYADGVCCVQRQERT